MRNGAREGENLGKGGPGSGVRDPGAGVRGPAETPVADTDSGTDSGTDSVSVTVPDSGRNGLEIP